MKTKVFIADDHPYTRAGVRSILEPISTIDIIGEAKDGMEAVKQVIDKQPDLVVMDISMPHLSGIEATVEILEKIPDIKIIALSIHKSEIFVKKMLDAGAVGYLLKDEASEELISAIEKVSKGDIYLSSGVTRAALSKTRQDEKLKRVTVLRSKLIRPPVSLDFVLRTKIIHELESQIIRPLSIVSAGAGYGKSIVVSQWLEQTEYLYSWLSLDEDHNDFRTFLHYLIASIEKAFPGLLKHSQDLATAPKLPSSKEITEELINELCEIEDNFILVLDDYHVIKESKIHNLLDEWLHFPPPNVHLCIVTRRDPPLKIRRLHLIGRITEIRMNKLIFSDQEIKDLFKQLKDINLNDQSVNLLYHKTEGWIMALQMALILIKNPEDINEVLGKIEIGIGTVSEFLASEVLSLQPEVVRNILLVSSILNRFSAELIDEISQRNTRNRKLSMKGDEFISLLKKSNLFVIALDDESKWFRYHHLFQALLKENLKKQYSEDEIVELHLAACHWFEDKGFLEEAMDHALIINDNKLAAEIIKANRLDLLEHNNFYLLEHLLRKIPTSIIESDPLLLLVELHMQWFHGNFVRLGELEERMNKLIDGLEKDSYIRHEYFFFVGFNSLFLKGDLATARSYFEKGMGLVSESASEPRGVLETHYMIFEQLGGEYNKVREMFYKLVDKEMPSIRKNRIYQGFLIATTNQANMHEFEMNYSDALAFARKSNMKDSVGVILFLTAGMKIRKGNWDDTIKCCNEVLSIRYHAHTRSVVDTMAQLIVVHSIMNEKSKVEEVIKVMGDYTRSLGSFFNIYFWSAKTRHHIINQDHDTVKECLRDYKPGVLDLVMYLDIPEITHARALIFEGSEESLEMAEEELGNLEGISLAFNNWVHIVEVKLLQAMLHNKKNQFAKAEEALRSSIEISEKEGMIFFNLEIGEELNDLLLQLKEKGEKPEFIDSILKEIESIKNLRTKTPRQRETAAKQNLTDLTRRELDVLQCIAEGLRNQEIAEKLFNTEGTIKKHIANMFQKMHVKNRLSLVTKAKEVGILKD